MARPPNPGSPGSTPKRSARGQLVVAAGVGIAGGVVAAILAFPALGVLIGWDVAAATYVARTWLELGRMDAPETARAAAWADPTRATADLALLGACIASLLAVGVILGRAARSHGGPQELLIGVAMVSVVVSWGVVHTVYALRYAALFYTGPDGGIGFNENDPPDYRDFLYVSLTIGMTFQVSDTELQSKAVRRTAVRHALLSYLFGAGIVATTVNLVASLTTK